MNADILRRIAEDAIEEAIRANRALIRCRRARNVFAAVAVSLGVILLWIAH